MNSFEIGILDFIREHLSCTFLDWFFSVITRFADHGIGWIITAIILLCFKKTRKIGFSMGLALIIGYLVGNMFLKNVIARVRPYDFNGGIELIINKLSDYSFPSGHTLCSFEGAFAVFIRNKKWGIAAIVFALLIALSRLYLYVHYPSDVIAGAILGIAIAYLASYIIDKIYNKKGLSH